MSGDTIRTRLARIGEREQRASKWPWQVEVADGEAGHALDVFGPRHTEEDCAFIAESRVDVPWLLALVQRAGLDDVCANCAINCTASKRRGTHQAMLTDEGEAVVTIGCCTHCRCPGFVTLLDVRADTLEQKE